MKKLIVLIVIFSMLYFVVGLFAVLLGWFPKDTYLTFSGIIGGLASVCGLLSFGIARKISNEDFADVEAAYLKKISDTADRLKDTNDELLDKSRKINSTQEELNNLENKKKEMEFLVKKASMSLFLQDQFERHQKRILELVENNGELKVLLEEVEPIKEKLRQLEQEIEENPNVVMLNEIIATTKREKESILEFKTNFFGIGIDIKQAARTIAKIISS